MSTTPEIVPFSETISQTAQVGFRVGAEAIAKSEMPEIGYSGETSQPGQEGLGVGYKVFAKSEMPEIGHYDVETSQPAASGSTAEISLGAAFDCDPSKLAGVQSKGQLSDAATLNGLYEILTAGTKLQSVSEKKSVEVELFEASKDSEWFDAIEKKNCKLLFRSDRSLWVQTGLMGRSVLHVAVMQGCSELVRELHIYEGDLVPRGEYWQTPFEFLWENARDGRLKDASARDTWIVLEGPSDHQFWSAMGRSRDYYIESHVEGTMLVDYEMLSLRDAIHSIADEKHFRMDESDVDFNFENVERKELYVHMACSRLRNILRNVGSEVYWETGFLIGCDQTVEFIMAVFTNLGGKDLEKLFDQKDAQGRTILQIFVLCNPYAGQLKGIFWLEDVFMKMLNILPEACVNVLDKAGRTVLHWAVAHQCNWAVMALLNSGKARPDVTFDAASFRSITAFHLILLYDLKPPHFYVEHLKEEMEREFCYFQYTDHKHASSYRAEYNPLAWAMQKNRKKFVKYILKTKAYQQYMPKQNELLAMAAWAGNVKILQLLLQKDNVDEVNVVSGLFGAPPLHLAVHATYPYMERWLRSRTFDDVVHCNDFISIELLEKKLGERDLKGDRAIANTNITIDVMSNMNRYSTRQICANLLLQAGADILSTDKSKCMADPGARAPNEARIWWYELVAKETLNIKNDLNVAATGTAVVATLVATASFVGPLQPPLNYVGMVSGTTTLDVGVQVTELLIKVFLVTNGLSFYLAITSIMLAIMPSLPIPKEGLVFGPCDDIKRSRRTISIAIGMLLASIISVLISFAASSLVVTPLQHRGLMTYSTSIGGLICYIGIFFFFLRFLRLICPRNTFIKKLYQKIGKL